MRFIATRYLFTPTATLSRLEITYDGALAFGGNGWKAGNPRGPLLFGVLLEDRDRGLDQALSVAENAALKVKAQTCIGIGDYTLSRTYSNRFHERTPDGKMILVHNVEGFEGIRWHHGKSAAWTEGCQLPGTKFDEDTMTLDLKASEKAWRWLDARVHECDERGEEVRLRLRRDPVAWAAFQSAVG